MDNINDTITGTVSPDDSMLPLQGFYAVLKENGFSVTPQQIIHANSVILQYANWVKNEMELCLYLTPVFAGSEDEQALFKKLYCEYFNIGIVNNQPQQDPRSASEQRLKKILKKVLIIYAAIAVVVVSVMIYTSLHNKKIDPDKVKLSMLDKNETAKSLNNIPPFQLQTNDKLEVQIYSTYSGKSASLETKAVFDWGDSTDKDPLPSHIYIRSGNYQLKAYVTVLNKGDTVKKEIINKTVRVCSSARSLGIQVSVNTDSVLVNEKITFIALPNNKPEPQKILWRVDKLNAGRGIEIEKSFTTAGNHSISCLVIDDSINSPCTIQKDIYIRVHDKQDALIKRDTVKSDTVITPVQTASTPPTTTDIVFLNKLYTYLALAFFIFFCGFITLWFKEMKKTGRIKSVMLKKYKTLLASFGADRSPAVLPFKNRNYIPAEELEIDTIAKQMRRRVKDHISFLHVQKTIAKTIEQGGLFKPVKEARTRQSEYLILIDEYNSNSLQVKLFEYLAILLKKHSVLVEVFYYKKEPAYCYNSGEPSGISLQKMYGKYQRHILLLFGNAYQLIDHSKNEIDEKYAAILAHWQHKAVITPVSFTDWQYKEKNILLPDIPLVPMDMQGLVVLAEMLTENETDYNITARLNAKKGLFYSSAAIDFNNPAALLQYCNKVEWARVTEEGVPVNVLFEWVAALAIYPQLRWEILLAVGKVITEKYGKGRALNFTSLLYIVRISWMKDGRMPDTLRLELLKKIRRTNEILVRRTILDLLKEIPEEEAVPGSSNFEEKEIQQAINEFSLYASDPVFYSSYRQSKYLFQKLWANRQLKDKPMEEYLKNSSNQWETLLNDNNNGTPNYTTGVEQYLLSNEKEETLLAKIYLALAVISGVVIVSSLFALRILYIWDNFS